MNRIRQLLSETDQIKNETEQLRKENAQGRKELERLAQLESKIDILFSKYGISSKGVIPPK
jgi:cell shape-determining protein MreC